MVTIVQGGGYVSGGIGWTRWRAVILSWGIFNIFTIAVRPAGQPTVDPPIEQLSNHESEVSTMEQQYAEECAALVAEGIMTPAEVASLLAELEDAR